MGIIKDNETELLKVEELAAELFFSSPIRSKVLFLTNRAKELSLDNELLQLSIKEGLTVEESDFVIEKAKKEVGEAADDLFEIPQGSTSLVFLVDRVSELYSDYILLTLALENGLSEKQTEDFIKSSTDKLNSLEEGQSIDAEELGRDAARIKKHSAH